MSETTNRGGAKPRILVVEDDPAIARGLEDVLVYNGYETQVVEDGGEGLGEALSGRHDIILLDVMLPTLDGFSVLTRIREKKPMLPVIMLTAKGGEDDIITGFKAGADDYVSKPFSIKELLVRVEAVLRRAGRALPNEVLTHRGVSFDGNTLTLHPEGGDPDGEAAVELTRREMEIVSYLYRHRERIVSKKELLSEVWRYGDTDIETRTVDIHMLKLRKKIAQIHGEAPYIVTIRGEGYRLEPEG